jgi:hypothetical protein
MVLRTAFAIIFAFQIAGAQVILTEVMFDPDGSEFYDEFVEIYNLNSTAVDLAGWQVGDSAEQDLLMDAGNGLILLPQQYGIILDPGYFENSTSYDSLIPSDALILTIESAAFGSGGFLNAQPEFVLLINSFGDTAQAYQYSIGNTPGHSDEKIILSLDNSEQNWGNSVNLNGTPGAKNSIALKDVDLAMTGFQLIEENFVIGQTVHFEAVIKNLGQLTITGFQFQKFYDLNSNQKPDSGEVIETVQYSDAIPPGDSLIINGEFEDIPAGQVSFGVAAIVQYDENLTNNFKTKTVYVTDPVNLKIIINEIMAAPGAGDDEWVELFNPGTSEINLANIYFSDASDTVQISKVDFLLKAGGYVVVGEDSAIANQYHVSFANLVVVKSFPTLNNSFDELKLLNNFNFVYDAVSYTDEWYGRDVNPGTSLEKINPNLNGQISENWSASVDIGGSTPARENSVFAQILPTASQLKIQPNPFSPDDDGFEDVAIIQVNLPVETAFINIRIYDTRGRRIRFLADSVPTAHQSQFVWDGKDDNNRVARIGAYICFVEALNPNKGVVEQLKSTIVLVKQ